MVRFLYRSRALGSCARLFPTFPKEGELFKGAGEADSALSSFRRSSVAAAFGCSACHMVKECASIRARDQIVRDSLSLSLSIESRSARARHSAARETTRSGERERHTHTHTQAGTKGGSRDLALSKRCGLPGRRYMETFAPTLRLLSCFDRRLVCPFERVRGRRGAAWLGTVLPYGNPSDEPRLWLRISANSFVLTSTVSLCAAAAACAAAACATCAAPGWWWWWLWWLWWCAEPRHCGCLRGVVFRCVTFC